MSVLPSRVLPPFSRQKQDGDESTNDDHRYTTGSEGYEE